MSRTAYQRELETLREHVLEMSDRVCESVRDALTALETGDQSLAADVITGDHEINEQYLTIEKRCIDLFALQQPVAGDLRFIAASFKISTDLERIGDLAVNIGEYARHDGNNRYAAIDAMAIGEQALEMVEDATAAYAAGDAAVTYEIAARDDDIDHLCETANEVVITDLLKAETRQETNAALFGEVSRTLLLIRDLERIGDHAVNIAARTLYMVENDAELLY